MPVPAPGLSDTDPEAARVQLELLRTAGPARRAQMAVSLSAEVIGLARRALRRLHPGESEAEIALRFVAQRYGTDLAARVKAHLAERAR